MRIINKCKRLYAFGTINSLTDYRDHSYYQT
jgi:hypothetical protein